MVVVDTHCHASLDWYEPIETLLYEMDRNGVDQAVLVQINGQFDNEYQFECVRRYPGRFANVVLVDSDRPDAVQVLERLAERGASGVRLRPTTRSPGDDPLAIWRAADRLGLAVSCGGNGAGFASDEFASTIEALPGLRFVIEHLGSISRTDPDEAQRTLHRKVFGLARFPNTFIKVTGLGEFSQRAMPVPGGFPFVQPIPPLLEEAYVAFGPSRMMWGSDFPPVAAREGYRSALNLTRDQLAAKSEAERELIFGQTALSIFFRPVRRGL
jgi:predicted TIM-barrel fold metal-dependent hydrolase